MNSFPAPEPEAEAGNTLEKRSSGLYACNAQNWDTSEDCVLLHPKIGVYRKILLFVSTPASHAKFCFSPTESMPTGFIDSVMDKPIMSAVLGSMTFPKLGQQWNGTWEDKIASFILPRVLSHHRFGMNLLVQILMPD